MSFFIFIIFEKIHFSFYLDTRSFTMGFQPFKTFLFGFAFSPSLRANVFEVIRLASFFKATLLLIHVGEKNSSKEQQFEALINECPEKPASIEVHWRSGEPVATILKACDEFNVDLLLLGALKRENMVKFYLGSIARKLTRKAPCSVLLMLKPSEERRPCKHIVVNGFDSLQTRETLEASFYVSLSLGTEKITIVEEISESLVAITVDDDRSLRKATIKKERINRVEKNRLHDIVRSFSSEQIGNVSWGTQSIFGRRGYSIGHYARVVRADLLIMNAQEESSFFGRFLPKDLEHILAELPTDVLIVKTNFNG